MILRLIAVAVFAVSAFGTQVFADGELDTLMSKFDHGRLERFDATKAAALTEAHAKGAAPDIAVLDAALAGTPLPFEEKFDPTGRWSCRVMKLGKLLPLVVYPRFKCRITDDGSGWFLQKLTGSQRTSGRLYTASDTRLIYLGAGTVNDDPIVDYGKDQKADEVAVVERLGKKKLVFMFPEPQLESLFDVLVLER